MQKKRINKFHQKKRSSRSRKRDGSRANSGFVPTTDNIKQHNPFLLNFDEDLGNNNCNDIKIKRITTIDWNDEDLFGDDDAGYVDIEVLNSFSIVREDCKKFFREKSKFIVLNAPKGSGKTTMCRLLERKINNETNNTALWLRDSDISPMPEAPVPLHNWQSMWSNRISYAILCQLVSESKGIISDSDLMDICNLQKETGERSKGLLNHLTDYFQLDFLRNKKLPDKHTISFQDMLVRLDKKLKHKVWIFIDEVDQGFTNSEQMIFKNSSSILACRNLVSKLNNIVIRSTIRPNVLAVIQSQVDSMANAADSIVPLDWSAIQIRSVVAKRVESYLIRTQSGYLDNFSSIDEKENWLLAQILKVEDKNIGLGKGSRVPHMTLSTLGKNRPRWVLNLLKNAAEIAEYNREDLITSHELFGCLTQYGHDRIKNIAAEYISVCDKIQTIITKLSLSKQKVFYHEELIKFINDKIISNSKIKITGISNNASATDVAELLYLIGVIDAGYKPGEHSLNGIERHKKTHMDFYNQPVLMSALSDTDNNINKFLWEIHPAFRYALGLERKKWKK
ncbi:P-loop ATPase, Sll1717 family [Vibrio alginolyticus]|uniref:P-loop ATPase, Sll1717 family n=1 Tax=Vibrio alginolyticus TaxID=663 RepID=UPI003D7C90FC